MQGSLLAIIPKTIPAAKRALAAMERDVESAETYDAIRAIERTADAIKLLFAEVDGVRQQAEQIVVLANHRIGREITAQPDARRTNRSKLADGALKLPTLKEQVGSKNTGLRLKKLAAIPRDTVEQTIRQLHEHGQDATVSSVLKQLIGGDKKTRRAEREQSLASKITALPDKKFGVILADPEWQFEPWSRETGMDRAADNHYPTSSTAVIAARDVPSISAKDCALFLCATAPMLRHAFVVMEAWGFDYVSNWMLRKDRIITGYWNRNQHEHLLLGVRGHVPCPAPGEQWDSIIDMVVGKHSAKPEAICEMIEAYFPHIPKIELNRRGPARPGWEAWGNEAEDTAA